MYFCGSCCCTWDTFPTRLEEGQIVGIDCGAEYDGYYGDHAKSFPVNKISDEKENY